MSSSSAAASVSIWAGDETAVIRISGRANFQSSVDFKATLLELWHRGTRRFILDLTQCQLMDSTFLGVMAGLGLKFSKETTPSASGPARIELLNPSARVRDLFDNLGIIHLFSIACLPEAGADLKNLSPVEQVSGGGADRKETTRVCLEAHQLLMKLNEGNISKFKDVTKFLEEDLKRMEGSTPAGDRQP
jgi:anti-anti-sigma factor